MIIIGTAQADPSNSGGGLSSSGPEITNHPTASQAAARSHRT
jgi:hypothetical protein